MFKPVGVNCLLFCYLSLILACSNVFSQEHEQINDSLSNSELAKKEAQAESLFRLAKTYHLQQDYPSSVNNFLSSVSIYESLNNVDSVAKVYLEITKLYQDWGAYDKALEYALNTYLFAQSLGNNELKIKALKQIAATYFEKGNYIKAINSYEELLTYAKSQKNAYEQMFALEYLAESEKEAKLYKKAEQHYMELLSFNKQAQNPSLFIAKIHTYLGFLNQKINKPLNALRYYQAALTIYQKNNEEKFLADAYLNIALSKTAIKKYKQAEVSYKKALTLKKKFGDKKGVAQLNNYLMLNSYKAGNKNKAFNYAYKAKKIAKEAGFLTILLTTYTTLARIHEDKEFYKESQEFYLLYRVIKDSLSTINQKKEKLLVQKNFEINKNEDEFKLRIVKQEKNKLQVSQLEMKAKQQEKDLAISKKNAELQEANYHMAEMEKQKIQNLLALAESNLYKGKQAREILLLQKNEALKDLLIQKQNDEQEDKERNLTLALKDNQLLKKDKELKAQEMKKQTATQKYLVIISFLIGVAFIIMGINWLFSHRKNKKLSLQKKEISEQNRILHKKQEEILTQRTLIEKQNEELKYQGKQVEDSIKAAALIQQAVLPEELKCKYLLGEHFIIYKPKNVVSGDFYWLYEVEGKTFMAVVDCTGHGVPGALTAMIGATLLDKIVGFRKVYEPNQILEQLHHEIEESFDGGQIQSYYGMDLSLVRIERLSPNETKVTFSAAKRPLYYILPNTSTLVEVKGTRRMIGGRDAKRAFAAQEFVFPMGTLIYMGTDGFADQADNKGKRFGTQNLKQLLSQISDLSLEHQAIVLEEKFQTYTGEATQRDDVLLIGFRV
jgi:serine phosphatase RsbU (regulator of sigma subunit)/tetratricopeptide (TPR) repeat protein